jgi:hypothetical protein
LTFTLDFPAFFLVAMILPFLLQILA